MSRRENRPDDHFSDDRDCEGVPDLADLVFEYIDRINTEGEVDEQQILREHPTLGPAIVTELRTYLHFDDETEFEELPTLGTLGDYTLRRQIGRGGMGVVYEAWENSMDRAVALKVLPAGVAADDRAFQRFMQEARTAGKLSHPNVVPVHATGQVENTPYFAMELVDGETLAQILAKTDDADLATETPFGKKDDARYFLDFAEAFADVADGLQHAHSKGVTHRDIKPSNLILDQNGRLRILDFGLARLEGQDSLTISGDVVGTPLYMSPEQARRKKIPVDHRTDVYSLGATMYEAICGRPPFRGKDHADTLSQVIERDPVEPRKVNPRVPKDLETIVLKCLRKDARDRFGTAEALGQDLRRFVRGDPIEAKPQSALESLLRRLRRYRRTMAVSGIVLLLVVVSGLLVYKLWSDDQARKHDEYDQVMRTLQMQLLRHRTTLRVGSRDLKLIDRSNIVLPDDFKLLHDESDPVAHAVARLQILAESLPGRSEAPYFLARGQKLLGRNNKALEALDKALDRSPAFVPARLLRTELTGRETAADLARRLLHSRSLDEWHRVWTQAYIATVENRWKDAAETYGSLLKLDRDQEVYVGSSMDFRLSRGLALLKAGEFRKASQEFTIIHDAEPEYMEPALLLGKSYYLNNDPQGAEDTFEELYAKVGREAAIWIAVLYMSLGDDEQARAWAERIEQKHLEDSTRERFLAWTYKYTDAAKAESHARKAIGINPEDTVSLFTLAAVLYWKNWWRDKGAVNLDEVIRLCEQSIRYGPGFAPAHALLAVAYRDNGKVDQALKECRRAEELDITDYTVVYAANMVPFFSGRTDELREFHRRIEPHWEELSPEGQAQVAAYRGYLRHLDGDLDAAAKECELSLSLCPQAWVGRNLGYVHLERGEHEAALERFRWSIDTHSRSHVDTLYSHVCGLLERLGRPVEAVQICCEAISTDPGDRMAHQNLLKLLRRYGEEVVISELQGLVDHLERAPETWDRGGRAPRTLAFLRVHVRSARDPVKACQYVAIARDSGLEEDPELLAILAEIEYAEGNVDQAIRTLETALEQEGATTWHWKLLKGYGGSLRQPPPDHEPAEVDSVLAELEEHGAVRINCGATEAYEDTQRRTWRADRFFRGGHGRRNTRRRITETEDPDLFRNYRRFSRDEYRAGYRIPLPNGSYRLTLHFMKERPAGQKVDEWEIAVGGQHFAKRTYGYDFWWVAAEAVSGPVTVDEGVLEVAFDTSTGRPHIAAIEIAVSR